MPGLHAHLVRRGGGTTRGSGRWRRSSASARAPRAPRGCPRAARVARRRDVGGAVLDDPQVLERRAAAHELLVDRARAVGVLAPAEARVDDGVAQRLGPLRQVGGLAQAALVVRAALAGVEVQPRDQQRAVLARSCRARTCFGPAWRPAAAAPAAASATTRLHAGADRPRRGCTAASGPRPAAAGRRATPRPPGVSARAEPPAVGRGRPGVLEAARRGHQHELRRRRAGGRRAGDLQHAVGRPAQLVDHGVRRAQGQRRLALAGAHERQLAARRASQRASSAALGQRHPAARPPPVTAQLPRRCDVVLLVGLVSSSSSTLAATPGAAAPRSFCERHARGEGRPRERPAAGAASWSRRRRAARA